MSAISYVSHFRLALAPFSEPFDLLTTFLTGKMLSEDCDDLFSFLSRRLRVLMLPPFFSPFTFSFDASISGRRVLKTANVQSKLNINHKNI